MTPPSPAAARSLAGAAVLVAGGAGFLGRVITRGLLDDGAVVLVPSRDPARLAEIGRDAGGRPGTLLPIRLSEGGPRAAAPRIARAAEGAGGLRAVVAAIGGFSIGPALVDLPEPAWQAALADHLTSHLVAMQAYAPLLIGAHDPVYVAMNGAAGYQAMAGSGAISVTGAAQRMLVEVMRAEPIGSLVRFHEIAVMAAVGGDDRNLTPAEEADPAAVVAALRSVLGDPGAAPVSFVGGPP